MATNFLDDPAFNELLAEKGIAPLQPQGDLGPQRPETPMPTPQRKIDFQSVVELGGGILNAAVPQVVDLLEQAGGAIDNLQADAHEALASRLLPADAAMDYPVGPEQSDPTVLGEMGYFKDFTARKARAQSLWNTMDKEAKDLPEAHLLDLDRTVGGSLSVPARLGAIRDIRRLLDSLPEASQEYREIDPDDDVGLEQYLTQYLSVGTMAIHDSYSKWHRQFAVQAVADPTLLADMTIFAGPLPMTAMMAKFSNNYIGKGIGKKLIVNAAARETTKDFLRSMHSVNPASGKEQVVINIAGNREWGRTANSAAQKDYMRRAMGSAVEEVLRVHPDADVKFISGGQLGADMEALKIAKDELPNMFKDKDVNITTGGTMAKGYMQKSSEEGAEAIFSPTMAQIYGMTDFDVQFPYRKDMSGNQLWRTRTAINVGDADFTLQFTVNRTNAGAKGFDSPGARLGRNIAANWSRINEPGVLGGSAGPIHVRRMHEPVKAQRRPFIDITENDNLDHVRGKIATVLDKRKKSMLESESETINVWEPTKGKADSGDNEWLSNLEHRPFQLETVNGQLINPKTGTRYGSYNARDGNIEFQSVEHAYQTMKHDPKYGFNVKLYEDPVWQTPGGSKKSSLPVDKERSIELMEWLVPKSFGDPRNVEHAMALAAQRGRFTHVPPLRPELQLTQIWEKEFPRILDHTRERIRNVLAEDPAILHRIHSRVGLQALRDAAGDKTARDALRDPLEAWEIKYGKWGGVKTAKIPPAGPKGLPNPRDAQGNMEMRDLAAKYSETGAIGVHAFSETDYLLNPRKGNRKTGSRGKTKTWRSIGESNNWLKGEVFEATGRHRMKFVAEGERFPTLFIVTDKVPQTRWQNITTERVAEGYADSTAGQKSLIETHLALAERLNQMGKNKKKWVREQTELHKEGRGWWHQEGVTITFRRLTRADLAEVYKKIEAENVASRGQGAPQVPQTGATHFPDDSGKMVPAKDLAAEAMGKKGQPKGFNPEEYKLVREGVKTSSQAKGNQPVDTTLQTQGKIREAESVPDQSFLQGTIDQGGDPPLLEETPSMSRGMDKFLASDEDQATFISNTNMWKKDVKKTLSKTEDTHKQLDAFVDEYRSNREGMLHESGNFLRRARGKPHLQELAESWSGAGMKALRGMKDAEVFAQYARIKRMLTEQDKALEPWKKKGRGGANRGQPTNAEREAVKEFHETQYHFHVVRREVIERLDRETGLGGETLGGSGIEPNVDPIDFDPGNIGGRII